MNKSDFIEIIRHQRVLSENEYDDILRISRNYPYFHTAYVLLLNSMYRNDDIEFSEKLKETAIYIADRQVLYNLLNSDIQISGTGSEEVRKETVVEGKDEDGIPRDSVEETEPQSTQKEESKTESSDTKTSYEPVSGRSREELIEEIQTRLNEIGAGDILQLDDTDDAESEIPDDSNIEEYEVDMNNDLLDLDQDSVYMNDDELVDRFINANPRIEPRIEDADSENEDLSAKNSEGSTNLVSETLASIYLSQGYYSRAIAIYEKLSLKYPEKSSYFASQIEKIEEIILKAD